MNINFYLDKCIGFEFIRSRPKESLKFAKNHFMNKKIVAIEIGILRGQNSKDMLRALNISKIYLIDPYERYEDYKRDSSSLILKSAEKEAKKTLNKYSDKIEWIKEYSEFAAKEIREKVDLIYIDGNHEYKYVKKDLEIYWNLLNRNGIISGHDIQMNSVSKAVLEFALKNELEVQFGDRRDWWIIK